MGAPKTPLLATDAVIIDPKTKKIVLIRRANEPFKDHYALPGGFVEIGETVENACIREAKEETSLDVEIIDLVGVFSDPNRDPRGHVVSIAFLCIPKGGELKASSDAKKAEWISISKINRIKLAFDHDKIISKALEVAKNKGIL